MYGRLDLGGVLGLVFLGVCFGLGGGGGGGVVVVVDGGGVGVVVWVGWVVVVFVFVGVDGGVCVGGMVF